MSDAEKTRRARNVKISRDEKHWEAQVQADIPADELARFRAEALRDIQKTTKLDGFRPGHAPESEIIKIYGEQTILRRAAEMAIQAVLPELFAAEKLLIIEAPKVTTEPPVSGKPLSFTARAPLAPEVTLPDYKKIAKHHPKPVAVAISDDEYARAMLHLRRERARIEKVEKGAAPADAAKEAQNIGESDLPRLDDEFVRSIGYESAAKFETSVRENMKREKERVEFEKRRQNMLEDIAKASRVRYPATLLAYELDDIEARLKSDLSRSGATLERYLADVKKAREDLRKEWEGAANMRTTIRLILSEIARAEKIEPDQATLEEEVRHALEHHKNADPSAVRAALAHALRNEAVIQFLESV